MTINSFARYALMGTLVVSIGCARNSEMDDTAATGRATTADTTAADTSSAGVVGADADSADFHVSPIDSVRTGVVEPGRDTTAGADTDTMRIHRDSANVEGAAPGWPSDTAGGWSTPSDSL